MSERLEQLRKSALSCIHEARAINDAYPDPTTIPGDQAARRRRLLEEAARLQDLADVQQKQDDLEAWSVAPAESKVLDAIARNASAEGVRDADQYAKASLDVQRARFAKAMRSGVGALSTEEKAAIIEDATGQIIVPHDLAGPIFTTLPRLGVLRQLATVRPTTSNYVDVRLLTGVTAGWGQVEITNAGGATPPTDASAAASGPTQVQVQDLVALAKIGVDELMDTDANLVGLIQEILSQKFAEMEDDAFAAGNGTSKPFGLATRATVGGAIPAAQGVTAAASAVDPDKVKSMPFLINSRYAANGVYVGSDDVTQGVALLKDANSNYLWQPSFQAGQPPTLNGYPYYRVSGLTAMTASTGFVDPALIFGDVRSGYLIADRQTITMQRLDERYADQGLVGFLFRLRVGGDVIRPSAFAKYLF